MLSIFRNLKSKLSPSQQIVSVSVLIGLVTGLEAVLLKFCVHHIQAFIQADRNFAFNDFLITLAPVVGLFLTVAVVNLFFNGKLGRGIPNVLYDIAQRAALVHRDKMYSSAITSGLTVGFGGSAGLEAPIVVTGSAIGSNFARYFHFGFRDRTVLLASGAAAGISAAFNAPITGAIFALEVLLTNVSVTEFIPIILSSVCGALLSKILLSEDILFLFTVTSHFDYINVPYYILLGVLCGFISLYYSRINFFVGNFGRKFESHKYLRAIIGGLMLSCLYLLFPSLFGEGYRSVKLLAAGQWDSIFNNSIISNYLSNEWFFIFFIGAVACMKIFATAITLSAGGNGGNFAPSLFVGAYTGFFFARLLTKLHLGNLPIGNFTLVGMAGILSGVFYAPITGIFLVAEITGGYTLILPLMIVSSVAYLIVKHFEPYSLDIKNYAQKGQILTNDSDSNVLILLKTPSLIEHDIKTIEPDKNLGDLVEVIKESTRNTFAVVDKDQKLVGIIELDYVRDVMFNTAKYKKITVRQLMRKPDSKIIVNESMREVMKKFDSNKAWLLPVVDENGKYLGFVSKSYIFNNYRKQLQEI